MAKPRTLPAHFDKKILLAFLVEKNIIILMAVAELSGLESTLAFPSTNGVVLPVSEELVIESTHFKDHKDFHALGDVIYCSGFSTGERGLHITRLTKKTDLTWSDQGPIKINGYDRPNEFSAPGILFDRTSGLWHLYAHTPGAWNNKGGKIRHYASIDGQNFEYRDTPISSGKDQEHGGVYDPHPSILMNSQGRPFYALAYTAYEDLFDQKGKITPLGGSSHLLTSASPDGPWTKFPHPLLTETQIERHLPTSLGGEWVPEGIGITSVYNPFTNQWEYVVHGTLFQDAEYGSRQSFFLCQKETLEAKPKNFLPIKPVGGAKLEVGHGTARIREDGFMECFMHLGGLNRRWGGQRTLIPLQRYLR